MPALQCPRLAAPDHPFRPGLHVKDVTGRPGVFEMTSRAPPCRAD